MTDKDEPLESSIEEPYTCVCCGKNNLKYNEIVWLDDEAGEIDLSTVRCFKCWIEWLPTHFGGKIAPEDEKEFEKVLDVLEKGMEKHIKQLERNYDRRTVRRATKK
jgi:hypothetical protein